jgi:phospholipid transport system substrate-binding protein
MKVAESARGVGLAVLALLLAAPVVRAAADQPRTAIQSFYDTLLEVMKQATKLGFQGRYQRLQPAIEQTYDLPFMTRVAIGPAWAGMPPMQQQQAIEAFTRFSVATYANRFDGYSGEHFEIVGDRPGPANGTLVETRLVRTHDEPVQLNYLLHQTPSGWRVMDVFLSGTISESASRRSEFSSVLRQGGPDALLALLNRKVADLTPH